MVARSLPLGDKPWGESRGTPFGATPTTYRFTGQREDASVGLYYYGARYYDSALGRFLSPAPIVPSPGNPQSLNRYAYVLNNPLRYTDPTGMFSEDEIMTYLGVDSWDAVLALFGEGGHYAGLWGWMEVLRQAEIGSTFGIYAAPCGQARCSYQTVYGRFAQNDNGQLVVAGNWLYGNISDPVVFPLEAAAWQGQFGGYYVDGFGTAAYDKHYHLRFDPGHVDWTSVGLGVASLGQDAGVALGVAGLGTGNPALITGGIALA